MGVDGDKRGQSVILDSSICWPRTPTLAYTKVGVGIDSETTAGRRFEEIMAEVALVAYDAEAARRAVDIQQELLSKEPVGAGVAVLTRIR